MIMALDTYALMAVSAFTIISALYVFLERRLLHSVAALALAFVGTAFVFAILGQVLVAILQLIVFVGGLSTYLVVAVASEERNAMLLRIPLFAAMAVVVAATFIMTLHYAPSYSAVQGGSAFTASAVSVFASQYALLYVMAALLFGTVISGVLVIKRFSRLLV